MTTSEFITDKTPRAGFWRVRAKANSEIAAVVPPLPQRRDGVPLFSTPDAVPATDTQKAASTETQPCLLKPDAPKARRVTAPVSVPRKTADIGAICLVKESADPTPRRNASPIPIGKNWVTNRFERLNAAIAFLKTHNVGVQVVDRTAEIKTYRVSSHGFRTLYHEDVIEIAMSMGWVG